MKVYPTIADSIESMSNGQIEKHKTNTVVSLICIIGGIPLVWWGISKWTTIGYEFWSYLLVFGGLFLIGWGTVLLTSKHEYVYVENGNRIKPTSIYLDPLKKDVISDLLEKGDLNEVLKYSITNSSPLMLELWQVDGHKLLYSQLLYAQHAKNKPVTPVKILNKDQLSN